MDGEPGGVFASELRAATTAILLTVALAAFEALAVAAALPQVAADLGGIELLPWVITAFLLTSGVATVASGPLVDGLGVARTFRGAVALFAVAGALAGLATSMPLLIAARLAQGAGAGATIAVALAAVGLVFPPRLVGRAFALNTTVWGAMGVAAPALAALLLTVASWRWVFLINLPLGALALTAGWRSLPGPVGTAARNRAVGAAARTRLDAVGLALVTAFAGASLVAVDALGPRSAPAAAAALVAGWWYLRRARRTRHPALAPRHLVEAPFGPLALSVALALAGAFAVQAFVPLYVQGGRGGGTALTAWSVLFFTIGWTLGANVGSRLTDRITQLSSLSVSVAFTVPALALVAVLAAVDAPLALLFAALTATGLGIGGATNAALQLLRTFAADDELGRASAGHQFVRNQGIAVGAALGGAILLLVIGRSTGDVELARSVLAGDAVGAAAAAADAIADGFTVAAIAGTALAAVALAPLLTLHRRRSPSERSR